MSHDGGLVWNTFRSSLLSGLFFTFLCMDMGGYKFFSALETRWMMVDRAGAFVRCIGEFLGGMIEEV
jgi:hypothetical protein